MKLLTFFAFWLGGWFTWAAIATTAISVGGSLVSANQTKKALQGVKGVADNLTYTPVDIAQLQKDAAAAAAQNAAASLNLERTLTPDVAAARAGLSKSVNDQLKLGGSVPADVANQVAQNARVVGGASGGFGGTPGVTAALLGTTALNLLNQRQSNAAGLLAANPLPTAGLDPGSIASAEIGNTNALNQFNAAKAGIETNLLNSQAQASSAQTGQLINAGAGLAGTLIKNLGAASPPTTTTIYPGYYNTPSTTLPSFNSTIPNYNASLIPGG